MNDTLARRTRCGAMLAIHLLFLMVWGFTGIGKVLSGVPPWFGEKFGQTILARFPGLPATFWLLTVAELVAFILTLLALLTGEFRPGKPPRWTLALLVTSLFIFVQLGLGQWLTAEYTGTQQLFMYFCGTLVCLQFVLGPGRTPGSAGRSDSP
jgi:hypothetical protein